MKAARMYFRILGIAALLPAILATSTFAEEGRVGNGNLKGEFETLFPRCEPYIIDERELLKRYLEEVQKRQAIEVRNEVARITVQQEIFQEYSRRWWETYNTESRKDKIAEYWETYGKGQDYARASMIDREWVGGTTR